MSTKRTDQKKVIAAVDKGDLKSLTELINEGININFRDRDERTLLMHAVVDNKIEIIKALIKMGADINLQDSAGWHSAFYSFRIFTRNSKILDRK